MLKCVNIFCFLYLKVYLCVLKLDIKFGLRFMLDKLNDYIKRSYSTSVNHGFHDSCLSVEHLMMLVISEVGEMVEADRRGYRANRDRFEYVCEYRGFTEAFESCIKGTIEEEISDVCIRLFDFCGCFGIEPDLVRRDSNLRDLEGWWLELFNERSLCECSFNLVSMLSDVHNESGGLELSRCVGCCLTFIDMWSCHLGIDLDFYIEEKMRYNEGRPKRHGKLY